ncbi:hypothetical protein MIDIC_510011 [Alphaproteobacteria bacterium]
MLCELGNRISGSGRSVKDNRQFIGAVRLPELGYHGEFYLVNMEMVECTKRFMRCGVKLWSPLLLVEDTEWQIDRFYNN